jgi:CBS domain-containing protein
MSASTVGDDACVGVSRVGGLMTPNPITVREDAGLGAVLQIMETRRIRHVLVVDARGRLVGLVTERDLVHVDPDGLADREPSLRGVKVGGVMRRQVATVHAECCTGKAARYMFLTKRGCLPVIDGERRPIGILTEADFLREFMRAGAGCSCEVHEDDWPRPSRLPA